MSTRGWSTDSAGVSRGALGGLGGGVATIANGRIFRSDRTSREIWTRGRGYCVCSGDFFVLAIALRLLIGRISNALGQSPSMSIPH